MQEAAVQKLDLTQKEQLLIEQMHRSINKSSLYILLGVSEDADNKQIRNAYYELSRHWHPDRFFRREIGSYGPQIEAIFTAVTEAYQTLSNEKKRAAYNRTLAEERAERAERAANATPASNERPDKRPDEHPDERSAAPHDAEASADIGVASGIAGDTGAAEHTSATEHPPSMGADAALEGASSQQTALHDVLRDVSHDRSQADGPESQSSSPEHDALPDPPIPGTRPSRSLRGRRSLGRSRGSRPNRHPSHSRFRQRVVQQIREGARSNAQRAHVHYKVGKQDLDNGNPIKAESALYLAVKLNPGNQQYRLVFEEAQRQARQIRAQQFVTSAESAEQYQNVQEALYNYRKAVEYETQDPKVFYRLGVLIKRIERDDREALKAFRTAVVKAPNNAEYRLVLADLYADQGLLLNARREYQAVIRIVKGKGRDKAKDKETLSRARDGIRKLS